MKNEIESLLASGNPAAIAERFGASAVSDLNKFIKHKDKNIRKNAMEAIGIIGGPNVAEPLIEAIYKEEDISLYSTIATALEKAGDLGLEPALTELAKPKHKSGDRKKFQDVLSLVNEDALTKAINSVRIVSPGNALILEIATRLFVKQISYTSYDKKLKYKEEKDPIKAIMAVAFKNKDDVAMIKKALEICEQFPRIGRFNWQPLVNLMNGNDEEIATASVRILGNIKAKKVIPEIAAKLDSKNYLKVRLQAAKTLGELNADDSVASLITTMEKDPDGDVQLEAIVSLGKIGKAAASQLVDKLIRDENVDKVENALKRIGPPAVPYLARAIEDPNDRIRKNAIELAQLILTTKYGQSGTVARLIEFLGDKSKQVQDAVMETITKMGDPGIEQLIIALREPEIRSKSAQILETFGSFNIEIVLKRYYNSGNAPRFLELASLLFIYVTDDDILDKTLELIDNFARAGKIDKATKDHIVANVLEQAFRESEVDAIYNSVQIARYFGDRTLPLILPHLNARDPELLEIVIESLGELGANTAIVDEEVYSSLASSLSHRDENVKIAAATALGKMRSSRPEVLAALVRGLSDRTKEVSNRCYETLVKSGQPAAERVIEGMTNPDIHEIATDILKELGIPAYTVIAANMGHKDGTIRAGLTSAILGIAESDRDIINHIREAFLSSIPEVHLHVIGVLGILKDEKAVPKMIQSYLVHQKKVKSGVVQALNNMGELATGELLKALATPDISVRKQLIDLIKELNTDTFIPALIKGLGDPQMKGTSIEALSLIGEKAIISFITNIPSGDIIKAKQYAETLANEPQLQQLGQKALEKMPR
ncbi:MAG: HEAT repeat domain-containing protein [Candidatus Odinarchaeota archaeon]